MSRNLARREIDGRGAKFRAVCVTQRYDEVRAHRVGHIEIGWLDITRDRKAVLLSLQPDLIYRDARRVAMLQPKVRDIGRRPKRCLAPRREAAASEQSGCAECQPSNEAIDRWAHVASAFELARLFRRARGLAFGHTEST